MYHYFLRFLLLIQLLILTIGIYGQVEIVGQVIDPDGFELVGVAIFEQHNTNNGTTTDTEGNFRMTVSSSKATLVIRYIGMETRVIDIQDRNNIVITLEEASTLLEEIFVSATSRPIRKIEASTAIESISAKEIERLNPTTTMDLLRFTPGVFVQTNSGRTRNTIYMRGFPDPSSSLLYTSLMIDGVKTFGSPEMVTDGSFRHDLNVEKIEIVRGSAATLYGRGAAAGAINIISKTGKEQLNGIIKATIGNNNWYQADLNINGSLSKDKSWRFNLGGFYLSDDGYRKGPINDKGGQFRFNIDKLFAANKGSLRLYGGVINLRANFYRDIPYAINDLSQPVGNWTSSDVVLQKGNAWEGQAWSVNYPDGEIASNEYDVWYPKGSFSEGFNAGANLKINLGKGFTLNNKIRYQQILYGVALDFSNNNIGGSDNNAVNTFGDNQVRLIIGGGRTDGGYDSDDFVNELRINKSIITDKNSHNLTFGGYLSLFHAARSSDFGLYTINTADADKATATINLTPFSESILSRSTRNSDAQENTYSLFVGDEMELSDQFTLNVGARYDFLKLDLAENKGTSEELTNKIDHAGISYSLGFNYLLQPLMAFYGNFSRSYRVPDFGAYTPVRVGPVEGTFDRPKVVENEFITNFELGYRITTDNWSVDAGFFWSDITNRRIGTYVGGIAQQVPAGDNHIRGTEISLIYTPQSIKGLYIRNSLTAQTTHFSDFSQTISYKNPANLDGNITETIDFEGNSLMDIPPVVWNLSIGYATPKFGFNLNNNYVSSRWADPYNTLKYPGRGLLNGNLFFNISKKFQIGLGATNIFNNQKVSSIISVRNAGAPTLYVAEKHGFTGNYRNVSGNPLLPRRVFATVQYKF